MDKGVKLFCCRAVKQFPCSASAGSGVQGSARCRLQLRTSAVCQPCDGYNNDSPRWFRSACPIFAAREAGRLVLAIPDRLCRAAKTWFFMLRAASMLQNFYEALGVLEQVAEDKGAQSTCAVPDLFRTAACNEFQS